jgi:hypothetical protein
MACLARVTVSERHVIGIRRPLEIGLMTLITARKAELIVIVHVARLTKGLRVLAGERKTRCRMIERSRRPGCRRMTRLARLAEILRHVIRIRRPLVIRLMALIAAREGKLIVIVHMA